MNKSNVVLGMFLLFATSVLAEDAVPSKDQGSEMREQRRQHFLQEKCHGDTKCEADMKQKFEAKRAEVKAEIDQQCKPDDKVCRRDAFKKIRGEMKEKHQAEHQNSTGAPATK
jgi:hypothetical protein